jgi:hypothetical protein
MYFEVISDADSSGTLLNLVEQASATKQLRKSID